MPTCTSASFSSLRSGAVGIGKPCASARQFGHRAVCGICVGQRQDSESRDWIGADYAAAIALQPDGKLVLASVCFNGTIFNFCFARLIADGTLDASFDGPSGAADGKFMLPIGANSDAANAMALQSDGKIV